MGQTAGNTTQVGKVNFCVLIFQLWLVSNCAGTYGAIQRMKYSNELVEAGLPIDRYGGCFHNKQDFQKLSQETMESYKFYLAFENALHCKDYLTEKFWVNSLTHGRVPVVWGPSKEDVTRLAPTKSFIHTENFASPTDLTAYLLYLNKNDTAYREYFQWIENPDERTIKIVTAHLTHWPSNLCNYIKQKNRKQTIVKSITDFHNNETKLCFHPTR